MDCVADAEIVQVGTPLYGAFAVAAADGVVLVDTQGPGHAPAVLRRVEGEGLGPIRLVVLTHAHADHVGSAAELKAAIGAQVVVGLGDEGILQGGVNPPLTPTGPAGRLFKPFAGHRFEPLTADLVVSDRLDLSAWGVSGEVRRVGGHTAGALVLVLDGGRAVVGDLLRSALPGPRDRPRRHLFHDDVAQAHAAVGALLDEGVSCLFVSHGGPLRGERVREWLAEGAP